MRALPLNEEAAQLLRAAEIRSQVVTGEERVELSLAQHRVRTKALRIARLVDELAAVRRELHEACEELRARLD